VKNLTTKTVHGVSWNLIATVSNSVLQIVYTAIMARLLTPSDFGLMAMAMVIIKFGNYFSKMGMAHALVQKKDLTNDDIRSVFTSSIFMGLLISFIIYITAPSFQYVFDTKDVVPLIKLLAITFVLKGLSITSLGLLGKNMEFKTIALIEISIYVVGNMGIAIFLAYQGMGVYSLIYGGIAQQILMFIISYSSSKHDLRPLFNWKVYKPLFSYGSRKTLISFLEYIGSSIDTFLIARFFGSVKLGLYKKARMVAILPTYNLTLSISKVIFPAFSTIQNDQPKLGKAYLSSLTLVSAFLFPISLGISAASEEIILVILGEQWTDAIPMLTVLALVAPFTLTSHFGGVLCDATAKLNVKFIFQLVYVILLSSLFFIFRNHDIYVYPVLILCAVFVKNMGYIFLAKNILNLNFFSILSTYLPGLLIGIAVYIGIYFSTILLNMLALPLLFKFIIQIIVGGIILLTFGLVLPFGRLKAVLIERLRALNYSSKISSFLLNFRWYRNNF